jgi:hypothetical protein
MHEYHSSALRGYYYSNKKETEVTSAKTAANIEKAFIDTASKIHEKIVSVEIDVSNENEESKLGRAEKRIGILVEAVL